MASQGTGFSTAGGGLSPCTSIGGPQGSAQVNNMAGLTGLWATALLATTINEEERQVLNAMSLNQHMQQLQAPADPISGLISLLVQKQETCQQKRWHVRIGDRDIILRDVAAKIISVLDVFKAVGDTAVQVDTGAAALPWALIRFVLQAAIEERNQMYALLSIVEGVSRIAARCRVYELLFVSNAVPSHQAHNDLHDALVVAYSHILRAIAHTSGRLEQRTMKKAWTAVIHPRETSEILRELERCDEYVRAAAASCNVVAVHRIDGVAHDIKEQVSIGFNDLHLTASNVQGHIQALSSRLDALQPDIQQIQQQISNSNTSSRNLQSSLQNMELPLFRIDESVSKFLKEIDDKDRRLRILDWVSKIKYGDHHKSVCDSRTPGTCDWLLQDARFVDWQSSSSSLVLLLYGSPGTGKTNLVSRVVDWLSEGISKRGSDEAFAYSYCNRNEESRSEPVQILRSIVRQLAIPRKKDMRNTIHSSIHDHYNVGRETATTLNASACRDFIKGFIDTYPQTTIVLDALDECDKECRYVLMDLFDDLLGHASRPFKLFIASRPDVDIKEHFSSRSFINIRASDNRDDISKYVHAELQKHPRWSKLSEGFKADIGSTLLQKSDGMFQWAALQVRQLLRLRTESAIRDRLGRLPKDLSDAYDEIYQEIESLHTEDKQVAHRAFEWVMCAKTPLGHKALLHAVCQDPTATDYQQPREEVDEALILDLCHNLLVFDTDLRYWRVSHLSVIEFFEEKKLHNVLDAHCNAAKICLSILLNTSLQTSSQSQLRIAYRSLRLDRPLVFYALMLWQTHVLALECLPVGDVDPRMIELLEKFMGNLSEGSPAYMEWHEFVDAKASKPALSVVDSTGWGRQVAGVNRPADFLSPIQFACHTGIFNLLWKWWSSPDLEVNMLYNVALGNGHDVPSTATWTLLSHAIYMGHYPIYKCLLRREADPDLAEQGSWTPLEVAAYRNSSAAVLSLLRHGAAINGPPGHENSAILSAVRRSSAEALKILLSRGGNANAMMAGEGNLLVMAVRARSPQSSRMLKWLIKAGADVMATSPCEFGSPVAAAAYFADLKSLRLLLKAGADPQMPISRTWGNALGAAAASSTSRSRSIEAMRLLIEDGADPNTLLSVESFGDTSALAVAVHNGAVDKVEFLLRNGADVNMLLPGKYWCALQVAIMSLKDPDERYSSTLVRKLLLAGAHVNLEPLNGLGQDGCRSVLDSIFQLAFRGKLCRSQILEFQAPPWMEAANILVEHGAVWCGNVGKLKVGLKRQSELTSELVDDFFCDAFLEKLHLNNASLVHSTKIHYSLDTCS